MTDAWSPSRSNDSTHRDAKLKAGFHTTDALLVVMQRLTSAPSPWFDRGSEVFGREAMGSGFLFDGARFGDREDKRLFAAF